MASKNNGKPDKPFAGKAALVTGSATGIGEAIARRLGDAGASVIVHGRPEEREAAQTIAREINEAGPGKASVVCASLQHPDECQTLVDGAAFVWGHLDMLVNNAAAIVRSDLETTTATLFDEVMAVNVRAPLLLIQAALPHFRANGGGGVVLNIGSVNGYCGERNQLAYSISKGALMTLSRNLSDAHGSENIRVNHFNLGWVLTPNEYALKMREGFPVDWPDIVPKMFAPSGRLLTPEEIAYFALTFLSPESVIIGAVVDLNQYPMIGRNPQKEVV